MILENYKNFIEEIYSRIAKLGIETNELKIDHIGYQADSPKDYDYQISKITSKANPISESIVGGRRVGIFSLRSPLIYQTQQFSVIEIFEPREGQEVKSAWEHIEFLVETSLEDFITQYPGIDFDTSVMNRDEFPMLILQLGVGLRAKFPRQGVLEEVKWQNNKKK